MKNKKVYITGITGMVGSHLAHIFLGHYILQRTEDKIIKKK